MYRATTGRAFAVLPRRVTKSIALLHSTPVASSAHGDVWLGPEKSVGREVVGYGHNGDPCYTDRLDYWYPAIRFKKADDTYKTLQKKELGDWKSLSIDEKKQLYRYSFRQTRAEYFSPKGYWKPIVGLACYSASLGIFLFWIIHKWIYPTLPATVTNHWKELELERMIDLRMSPYTGVASKWDYEKDAWKK